MLAAEICPIQAIISSVITDAFSVKPSLCKNSERTTKWECLVQLLAKNTTGAQGQF